MNIKQIISKISSVLNLQKLINLTGVKLILPFYHTVSDIDLPHVKHLYPVLNIKRFRKDIDFLLQNFKPISSSDLLKTYYNDSNFVNRFFLSFDDGLREVYDVIAPILKEKGVPATFFLNTDFIDNKAMFCRLKTSLLIEKLEKERLSNALKNKITELLKPHNIQYQSPKDLLKINSQSKPVLETLSVILNVDFDEYLKKHRPYLTSNEIQTLINQGFTIGSHSCSHPYYHLLSEDEQVAETLNSIQFLQKKFNIKENLFSFPYTDFGVKTSFFEKISNTVDLSFGTASLKADCIKNNLQRIPMERKQSAKEILKEEYLLFFLKKTINKHTINRN